MEKFAKFSLFVNINFRELMLVKDFADINFRESLKVNLKNFKDLTYKQFIFFIKAQKLKVNNLFTFSFIHLFIIFIYYHLFIILIIS